MAPNSIDKSVQPEASEISKAERLLGSNPPGNIELGTLSQHIARLTPEAGPLIRVLEDYRVGRIFAEYQEKCASAAKWQQVYKRSAAAILGLLALALVAGGLALLISVPEGWQDVVRPLVTVIVYASVIAPLVIAWRIMRCRAYERWNETRGAAEHLRRKLFETVADLPAESRHGELSPHELKLEYVRRYQLEVQEAYHTKRQRQFGLRAELVKLLILPCLAVGLTWASFLLLAAVGTASEQGPSSLFGPGWFTTLQTYLEGIEFLGIDKLGLEVAITIAALYGAVFLWSHFLATQRNKARFGHAAENLAYLRTRDLPQARRAAANSSEVEREAAVRGFVTRLHSVMASELADWVRLQDLERGIEAGLPNMPAGTAARG